MASLTRVSVLLVLAVLKQVGGQGASAADEKRSDTALGHTWSGWSRWDSCSMSCGQGTRHRYRECVGVVAGKVVRLTKPTCPGATDLWEPCNMRDCEKEATDPRVQQCTERNDELIYGDKFEWIPFYGGTNPCSLKCLAQGYTFYYNFGPVKDGTACNYRSNTDNMCVKGKCEKIGCDGLVGSRVEMDKCRVCGGRDHNCVHYRNVFTTPLPNAGQYGYHLIVKIPKGSTYLMIKDNSSNFLAVADTKKAYIINGNWIIDWPGNYEVAGTTLHYRRVSEDESLNATGPTQEDLNIMLIFRDKNPGVHYEFYLPRDKFYEIKLPRDTPRGELTRGMPVILPHHMRYGLSNSSYATIYSLTGYKPTVYDRRPSAILPKSRSYSGVDPELTAALVREHRAPRNRGGDNHLPEEVIGRHGDQHEAEHHGDSHASHEEDLGRLAPGSLSARDPELSLGGLDRPSRDGRNSLGPSPSPKQGTVGNIHRTEGTGNHPRHHEGVSSALDGRPSGHLSTSTAQNDSVPSHPSPPGDRRSRIGPQKNAASSPGSHDLVHDQPIGQNFLASSQYLRPKGVSKAQDSTKSKEKKNSSKKKPKGENGRKRAFKRSKTFRRDPNCPPCRPPKGMSRQYCTNEFVVRAQVMNAEFVGNDTRYELKILNLFRNKMPLTNREYIWVPNRCHCPRMRKQKEYVITANFVTLEHDETRLQVTVKNFVRVYSEKVAAKLKRFQGQKKCDKQKS